MTTMTICCMTHFLNTTPFVSTDIDDLTLCRGPSDVLVVEISVDWD